MDLLVNGQERKVKDIEQLRLHLEAVRQWSEIYLNVEGDHSEHGFLGLIVLVNGARALLIYLRYEGDQGLTSRDSSYHGSPDATIEFTLSNGQLDRYPLAWTVGTEEALRAVAYIYLRHAPPPWITWDSAT